MQEIFRFCAQSPFKKSTEIWSKTIKKVTTASKMVHCFKVSSLLLTVLRKYRVTVPRYFCTSVLPNTASSRSWTHSIGLVDPFNRHHGPPVEKHWTLLIIALNFMQFSRLILSSHNFPGSKKSNLHYTRRITPKRVTSCGAHLRGLAPGLHSSEETSQRWRVVGDTVSI